MKRLLQHYADKYSKEHKNTEIWKKTVIVLSAIAFVVTIYLLITPAINMDKSLLCGLEEHTHTEECYGYDSETGEKILTCGKTEHVHTAECFDAPPAEEIIYYCGMVEHVHAQEKHCYFNDGSLLCTIPEHKHTLACMSNPNDAETEEERLASVEAAVLNGDRAEDIAAIAETQLGYEESKTNYFVEDDGGTVKGYTRYGDMYGDKYGDWNTMFCGFCMYYASVDEKSMPFDASCRTWIEKLKKAGIFYEKDECSPSRGDLVFFASGDSENDALRVGIISETVIDESEGKISSLYVIEGDCENKVCKNLYNLTECDICGYCKAPENPNKLSQKENDEIITVRSEPASDGAVALVSGKLPDNSETVIKNVSFSDDSIKNKIDSEDGSLIKSYAVYDIKIMSEGSEWQPDGKVGVVIKQDTILKGKDEDFNIVHINGVTGEYEKIQGEISRSGEIRFTTEGFSRYIFFTSARTVNLTVKKDLPDEEDYEKRFTFRITVTDSEGNAENMTEAISALCTEYPDNNVRTESEKVNVMLFDLSETDSPIVIPVEEGSSVQIEELSNEGFNTQIKDENGMLSYNDKYVSEGIYEDTIWTVINRSGTLIPKTGGSGRNVICVSGVLIILCAAFIVIVKSKKKI